MRRLLAGALFVALATGPALAETPEVAIRRNLAFGPLPEQTLTTCRPADDKVRAGVVLIHGGGWVGMDKADLIPICEALARDGLFAATVGYRLVKKADPSTFWPAQLADVQLAVRWLRANASALGLDGARLCSYGESAGGHLAVFLAAKKTIEPSDMRTLLADQPVSVVCAVDNFGPIDLTEPGPLKDLAQLLVGRQFLPRNKALFREASPLFLIGRDTAPIYIQQGIGDGLVQPIQSFKLLGALTKANVPAHFVTYAGGHAWKNVSTQDQALLAEEELQFLKLFLNGAPPRPGT